MARRKSKKGDTSEAVSGRKNDRRVESGGEPDGSARLLFTGGRAGVGAEGAGHGAPVEVRDPGGRRGVKFSTTQDPKEHKGLSLKMPLRDSLRSSWLIFCWSANEI